MKYVARLLLVVGWLAGAQAQAQAVEIKGVTIPETASIPTVNTSLVLNGAGIRKKFFVSVYVGALYLVDKTDSPEQVLAADQPRRVALHFVYDKVDAEKLRSAWSEGFEDNVPAGDMGHLKDRLKTFNSFFGDAVKGDVVHLDYIPGVGTRVSINGEVKGTIPGADFNRALLSVWLGDKPVTQSLKEAMLGR